ncbi:protein Niban-like [Sinocyclocheilus rhinocerous]|uniref:protein Niban-like n=1 Tax=Sinocyclocheilus rhinocerous TaxID=307959 RepID=UPI0007B9C1AB|nr:PREDICTED: protein Niban-like [Sinocyclocheilus rhinocerous]
MGASSSLLDENKSNYIKGQVDEKFKEFAPIYRKQYSLAYLSQIRDELEQRKEEHTQLLKQRASKEPGKVLYEENVQCFDDSRKWKDRYIVIRANYVLECYESYKRFLKGSPPLHRLMPTGGTILTTQEKYMEMINQCCPCTSNVQEDFAPPVADMPGQFPVYLRLPYRRDFYFCFQDENSQVEFISILSDCVRHQNKDFLKKKTCEVKAFLKAIQLYRQEKGQYESCDMLLGSDVRGLANLFMEDSMPFLEKELEPCLKSKRTDKRRVWFATVEATYFLLQEHLFERMKTLKQECQERVKRQDVLMRSDMDQITSSTAFLEGKLRAMVTEPATKYCTEQVQPYLPAILEEVMGPISLGFTEARDLSEGMMEQLCQDFQDAEQREELRQALFKMSKANLQSCYEKVNGLADHVQELQQTFNYRIKGLVDSTQLDLKQLMENTENTFELLVRKALEDPSVSLSMAMQKASNRVLKQFDYDSSTVRKRILQEALINITLPSIKKHLAPSFKEELPKFEQYIFADYTNFINMENVYEDIIQEILEKDVSMVVKEAASKKKFNLFSESRYNFSVSSLSFTPPGSAPSSPGHLNTSPRLRTPMPPSPLLGNGLTANQSVTVHSSESSALEQALPIMGKIDEGENKTLLEESSDDVFVTAETSILDTSAETKPELTTNAMEALVSSIPIIKVTEAVESAGSSNLPTGGDATSSDFANKPTVVVNPICMKTSGSNDEPAETEDNSEEMTEDSSNDPARIKALIHEESTYPIAVCLSIQDAEDGDIYKEFTGKQIMDLSEKVSESQSLPNLEDEPRPLDCVKEIRDLVVEVIEIEDMVQPSKDNGEKVQVQTFEEQDAVV